VSVSQCELLVGVLLYDSAGTSKSLNVERLDSEFRQLFQEN
jgi:hypothetical protein